jgi:hypothetical protein
LKRLRDLISLREPLPCLLWVFATLTGTAGLVGAIEDLTEPVNEDRPGQAVTVLDFVALLPRGAP